MMIHNLKYRALNDEAQRINWLDNLKGSLAFVAIIIALLSVYIVTP